MDRASLPAPLSAAAPTRAGRGLLIAAILAGLAAFLLGLFAWLANAETVFVELANAALAMCF